MPDRQQNPERERVPDPSRKKGNPGREDEGQRDTRRGGENPDRFAPDEDQEDNRPRRDRDAGYGNGPH